MKLLTWRRLALLILLLAVLAGVAAWSFLHSEAFWRWSGQKVVSLVQESLEGDLSVREIRGTPFRGMTLLDLRLTTGQGEVLAAPRVELRLSLWSLLRRQPVVARLAFIEPRLTLRRDQDGAWEAAGLVKADGRSSAWLTLKVLTFSQVAVEKGRIILAGPGESRTFLLESLECALNILHPLSPQRTVQLRRGTARVDTPWGRFDLSGRLAYSLGHLNLLSLSASTNGRHLLSLAGEVRLGEADPTLRLVGEAGPAPAALIRRLWSGWPAAWDPQGTFQLEGTTARAHLSFKGGAAREWTVELQGDLGWQAGAWDYDVEVKLRGLKLSPWAEQGGPGWAALKHASPLNVQLQARGRGLPWQPQHFAWSLAGEPVAWKEVRLESWRLELSGNDREQNLTALVQGNAGRLEVKAVGPLRLGEGSLTVKAQGLQPGRLGLAGEEKAEVSGTFTGSFRLPAWDQPERLRLAGELDLKGRFREYEVREFKGRLAWERHRLEVGKARLALADLSVDFFGTLAGERLDFTYQAQFHPGRGPLAPGPWRGQLSGEGRLSGALSAPEITVQGRGSGLAAEGWSLGTAAFTGSSRGWPPHHGSLEVQGTGWTTPLGAFAQVRFQGEGQDRRWRFSLRAQTPQGPQAELAGTADLGASPRSLTLDRTRLQVARLSLENVGPVPLRFSPGLEVGPAAFRVGEGRVNIALKTVGGAVSGQAAFQGVPAGLFSLLGASLGGRVSGRLAISGEARQPQMDGQFSLEGGRWGEFAFQSLRLNLTHRGHRLQFSGNLEEKAGGPRLTGEGFVPLHFSLSPFRLAWGEEDFQVRLRGDRANLSLLTGLTPEIEEARGELDLEALWQGKVGQPRLTGRVRWGEGAIKLRQSGAAYRLEPGTISLDGDRLNLARLTLVSGGTAMLSGNVTLAGFRPDHLDLRARLDNFKVVLRGGSEATVAGALTLTGPWSAPVLQGRLVAPSGSFHAGIFAADLHEDIVLVRRLPAPGKPPSEPQPPPTPGWNNNLKMDVSLETPGVWVRDTRLRVLLAGGLRVRKQPGRPLSVAGQLKPVRGTIEVQGRSFKVVEGVVTLPEKAGATPTLKGKAVHEMREITLVLLLSGPVSGPDIRLDSIPPLPPQDLLSYLVFGRSAQTLSREEYLKVGPQTAGILAGFTAKRIQEFLGKDFPLLEAAAPLTKDITISFERKTNPISREDVNQVRLEYRLNRRFSIESQLGRRNSGGDVLFNLDW